MKRFTATEKWAKEWFQDLAPRLKCLWLYLCDNCDHSGVWEPNFKLAALQIGEKVREQDFEAFGERIAKLESGKFLIPAFIGFQYGKLSETCPAHKPVFRALERNRVTDTLLNTLTSTLPVRVQDMDKDKEEEKGSAEGKQNKARGSKEEISGYCAEAGLTGSDGSWVFDKWEGNGWKNGGDPIRDWKATVRAWKARRFFPSQKNAGSNGHGPARDEYGNMRPSGI